MSLRGVLVVMMLSMACAHARPDPAAPPRIKDSVPEQSAALRAADGRLRSDDEEQRWGLEAAKARKHPPETDATRTVVIPMPPPNDSGLFASDGGAG